MEYLKDAMIWEFSEVEIFTEGMKIIARRNITRRDGIWYLNLHGAEFSSEVLSDLLLIVKLQLRIS